VILTKLQLIQGHAKANFNQGQVSEWAVSKRHSGTIRLYSVIHVGTRWKVRDRRQIKNRHYKN